MENGSPKIHKQPMQEAYKTVEKFTRTHPLKN